MALVVEFTKAPAAGQQRAGNDCAYAMNLRALSVADPPITRRIARPAARVRRLASKAGRRTRRKESVLLTPGWQPHRRE
jgi:hypothetical protein